MSHLRIWRSKQTGDVYFSGKVAAGEVAAWLRVGAEAIPDRADHRVFHIVSLREEAQEHDGHSSGHRPQH